MRAAVRRPISQPVAGVSYVEVAELGPTTVWTDAVSETDVLVHTAARVHVMNDTSGRPSGGVSPRERRRHAVPRTPEQSPPAFGGSCSSARSRSTVTARLPGSRTAPTILRLRPIRMAFPSSRPKTVCGSCCTGPEPNWSLSARCWSMAPAVKANFLTMMRWVHRGVPLPFGNVPNKRSLVALDNLVDLIVACCVLPAAVEQTFLAADGEDLSTTELLTRMAAAMNRRARLLPVPVPSAARRCVAARQNRSRSTPLRFAASGYLESA